MSQKNFTPIDDLIKKNNPTPKTSAKELEPQPPVRLIIKETEDIRITKEVAPHIEKREGSIKLPPDLQKIGLQASPPPTQTVTVSPIKLPLSDDKIINGLHAPITSSLRWLATLAFYILKQAHIGLKIVHGHVVRVLKKN